MHTDTYIFSIISFSVVGERGFIILYENKQEKNNNTEQLPLQIPFWDSKTFGLAEIFLTSTIEDPNGAFWFGCRYHAKNTCEQYISLIFVYVSFIFYNESLIICFWNCSWQVRITVTFVLFSHQIVIIFQLSLPLLLRKKIHLASLISTRIRQ